MEENKIICGAPFQSLEIHEDGTYVCCSNWCNFYKVGDIKTQTYEEIWNSEEIKKFRKKMLDGNSNTICNNQICPFYYSMNISDYNVNQEIQNEIIMKTSPQIVKFAYDCECNINCNFCRDRIIRNDEKKNKEFDKLIKNKFLPVLKDTKRVLINGTGEPFASKHSKKLIGEITKKYKNIKFDFFTNGTLCSERMLKSLKLTDKIYRIRLSLNAATRETYNTVCPGNGKLFDVTLNNIKYLSKLREKNNFEFFIQMVITSDNYKDIPEFIELCHRYNAYASLWQFYPECCTYENAPIEKLNIFDNNHPNYNELIKILQHENLKKDNVSLSPLIISLIKK